MLLFVLLCCGAAAPTPPTMVDKLLPWTDERRALTVAYAQEHTGREIASIEPAMIVLHGIPDADLPSVRARFGPARLPSGRADLAGAGALNVAVHYAIDRNGTIARLLDEERYARHVVGFNHVAIGIEHLGDGPEHDLTQAQVRSSAWLVRNIASRHPIRWLHGHHQLVNEPELHPLFTERNDDYRTFALDPGDAFVEAVAHEVQDLGFNSPQQPEGLRD